MTSVAIVAAPSDGGFAAAIRAALPGASLSGSLPGQFAGKVILLWSAALDALHSFDAQALVGLWADGRLTIVRRDGTPLPLGMRDLDALPPETKPEEVAASLAGERSAPRIKSRVLSPTRVIGTLLALVFFGGSAYYYFTKEQRSRQAELTRVLEAAAKASQGLNEAKEAEVAAQKRLAEARQAELEAIKRGDISKAKELEEARKRAEAEAAKQAELVKQREAAAQKTREDARKASDVAKTAAVAKAEAPKAVAAVEAKAETPKVEVAAKSAAPARPMPQTRSERARVEEDRIARELAAKKSTQVAAVSPSQAAPAAAAPTAAAAPPSEELLAQAQAMEATDPKGAVKMYRSLARRGDGKAAKRLGDIYDRGIPGVPRDYQESLSWYEKARDLGETIAMAGRRNPEEAPKAAPAKSRPPKTQVAAAPVAEAPKAETKSAERPIEAPKAAKPPLSAPAMDATTGREGEIDWLKVVLALAILALAAYVWRRSRKPVAQAPAAVAAAPLPAADGSLLFVSYSRKAKARIEPIVKLIEQTGRQVWMDRTGITGQAGWAGQIVRAIRQSRAVVLMASPNSYSSDQVVRELYLAMNHKKPIVPIEIEPADLPDELQYILAPFQHHRLSGGETREVLGRALAAV